MMKLWSSICFLVLATSSIFRGQNATAQSQSKDEGTNSSKDVTDGTMVVPDGNKTQTLLPLPSSSPSQRNTSVNTTDLTKRESDEDKDINSSYTTKEVSSSTVAQLTTLVSAAGGTTVLDDIKTVSITTESTSSKPVIIEGSSPSSSWGYVILVLIILVIIILCVILYFLRRVSRTYSFDLQRPSPISRLNEPTGTFEPVFLDDLDRPVPKDEMTTDDLSPPPVANGTSVPSEDKGSSGEIAPQEQPDGNGVEASPGSNASPTTADDSADKAPSPSNSTNLFFEALGEEQQNENNNNPSICSSDPFVEINLDEPALCDQLLTSPEATSSVLPFSPFSFSSSSSSS